MNCANAAGKLAGLFHQTQQPRAGLAQALRKHGDHLDQDLRTKTGMIKNDFGHVVASQHGEGGGL